MDDIEKSIQDLLDAGAEAQQGVSDVGGRKLIATVNDVEGNMIETSSGTLATPREEINELSDLYELRPVGRVESSLADRDAAPKQGDEGAPPARIVFRPEFCEAARDLRRGDEVIVLTWLHQGRRDVLSVHPRGDTNRPLTGVFATRSPDRPNPIGLHPVRIEAVEENGITVHNLEAIDGTPVLDIKPVLGGTHQR